AARASHRSGDRSGRCPGETARRRRDRRGDDGRRAAGTTGSGAGLPPGARRCRAGTGPACHDAGMRVVVVGVGQVGETVVKSLAETHECTVIDVDRARLEAVSHAYDVRVTHGSGTRRETLLEAGIADAELVLACTSRDEVNLVTAMLARRLSSARTAVRATGTDYLAAWHAGDLDVDLPVSTAHETAQAVARVLEVPGARHVDFFADGKVAVIGVHVPGTDPPPFACRPLGEADLPEASRVVAVVRDGAVVGSP